MGTYKELHMRLLLLLFLLIIGYPSTAQTANSDSTQLAKAIQVQQLKFQEHVNTNALLYNGTAYLHYWNKEIGHPYFETAQFQPSEIVYKEFRYRNVLLKYDLLKKQLVTLNASKEFEMALLNENILEFIIGGHVFININNDSIQSDNPGPGFYEVLYKGKTQVIAKYYKRVEASLKAEDNYSKFVQYSFFYIKAGGAFHLVEASSDIYQLLKDQRAVLRKYSNKEKLHYSKNPDKTIVSLAIYYDSIKHD